MGGCGSGNRWRSSSSTCEAYKRIDLRYLKEKNWLSPGQRHSLSWSHGDEPSGTINYWAYATHLKLEYKSRNESDNEWQEVAQHVPFDFTPLNFGGHRQWFRCPRCHRRCLVLYGGARFYCRKCYRLKYQSQAEDSAQRAITRAQATRKRLGGFEGIDDPFPPKPKGMHWKTYNRLAEADDQAGQRWDDMMMGFIAKFDRFKR